MNRNEEPSALLWVVGCGYRDQQTYVRELVNAFLTVPIPFRVLLLSESAWRSAADQNLDETVGELQGFLSFLVDFSCTPRVERPGWVRIEPYTESAQVREEYRQRVSVNKLQESENRAVPPWYLYSMVKSGGDWEISQWQRNPGRLDQLAEVMERFRGKGSAEIVTDKEDTQRLRTELGEKDSQLKKLKESEERYRLFFEDDITGDFLMDEHWRIVDCNTSFYKIFGFPAKAFAIGFPLRQVFPDPDTLNQIERDLRATQRLEYYELELVRQDGQKVNVIATLALLPRESGAMVRGFFFDNTLRKSLEYQLLESQRMEGLGRLAGGIAHDFNNILTVINGYAELLMAEATPGDKFARDLGEILEAGRKAAALTSQLLAFSRRQMRSPELLSVNALVQGMQTILKRLLRESIELKTLLDPSLPTVLVDKSQWEQALMNLCLNGQDAMPNKGILTIQTKRLVFDRSVYDGKELILPGVYAELSVIDQGLGIPEHVRPHIFEPFYTTKDPGKGTGLGLATVYGIVQQSRAHILVEFPAEGGTRFRVLIPEHQGKIAEVEENSHSTYAQKGNILLVEDEEMVREFAVKVLARKGHNVQAFATSADLIAFLKLSPDTWDLLVTDVVMPGKSGPEMVKTLASEGIALPVLYISGYPDDELQKHGVGDTSGNFLHKPFKSQDFLQKIAKILADG